MSYVPRSSWALWLFIFALFLASGWLFFDSRDYNHRRYVEQTLEGLAKLKAASIETWRDTRLRDAEMLALNPVMRDAITELWGAKAPPPARRAELVSTIRQQMLPMQLAYEYKNIRILDRHGEVVLSLAAFSHHDDEHLHHSLERAWLDRIPVLTEIHVHDGHLPVMDVVVPLFLDEDGEDLGLTLNLVIDPRLDFYPSLKDVPIPSETYEALLVRQEGQIIRFITPLRHLDVPLLSYTLPMESPQLPAALGLRGHQGVVPGNDYRQEPVLAVSTHISDTSWVLIVKMDRAEALRNQYRETRYAAVGLVILVVAVVALIFLAKAQAELLQTEALQEAQSRILVHESRQATILRAAPIGVGIIRDRCLLEVNQTFCQQVDYQHNELIGRSIRQLYQSKEAFDRMISQGAEILQRGERYASEARLMRSDGTVFDGLINVAVVDQSDLNGDLCFTIADITERKAQEEKLAIRTAELERSNADLTTFAYVASHDLRSPLRGISQLSEWVRQDMPDTVSDDVKNYLDLMGNRITRMETLLDDLLEYSRVGRIEGDIEEVSVAKLCQDCFDLQQPPESFALRFKGELPTFVTLSTPLELIFRNLIGNAIKHRSTDQGWVEIRAKEDNDQYLFFVADNGPGIAPKYHERIFALFQTLRPRDEVEGSGMGLAIIKRVLEAYDGEIQVSSDGGSGAEFVFSWPKEPKLRRLLNARKSG